MYTQGRGKNMMRAATSDKGPGKTSLTFEWDTGMSGEGTSWAGEIASSKPVNLERSLS